ncbi:hypothetical protein SHIRM173S_07291 [Streptomyces hirsutus]
MNRTLKVASLVAREVWLPVLLVAAWWWLSAGSTSLYWPALSEITDRFVDLWFFDHLLEDALPSVVRLVTGFGIGFAAAVVLGLVLGSVPALEDATRPLVEFMRALPSVALLPIMMLLLGTDDDMKVVTIAFVSTWPILLNTVEGVRSVDPVLHQVAAGYRLSTWHRIRYVAAARERCREILERVAVQGYSLNLVGHGPDQETWQDVARYIHGEPTPRRQRQVLTMHLDHLDYYEPDLDPDGTYDVRSITVAVPMAGVPQLAVRMSFPPGGADAATVARWGAQVRERAAEVADLIQIRFGQDRVLG